MFWTILWSVLTGAITAYALSAFGLLVPPESLFAGLAAGLLVAAYRVYHGHP